MWFDMHADDQLDKEMKQGHEPASVGFFPCNDPASLTTRKSFSMLSQELVGKILQAKYEKDFGSSLS